MSFFLFYFAFSLCNSVSLLPLSSPSLALFVLFSRVDTCYVFPLWADLDATIGYICALEF